MILLARYTNALVVWIFLTLLFFGYSKNFLVFNATGVENSILRCKKDYNMNDKFLIL